MGVRERLDTLSRGELTGLVLALVVTLAGAALWYLRSLPKPVQVTARSVAIRSAVPATPSVGGLTPSAAGTTPSPSGATVVVDVAGEVRRPGVYTFHAGARVVDAVRRAGGALHGADLSLLNLAAPLTDGTQILVPKSGEPVPASGGAGGVVPSGQPAAPVNINTATESELDALYGVGPVTANAIIQYRTEHGPFRSVDDLINVSGIGPVTLEELRPFVTV
jgi:competence protein ComEA